jgi:hypothetical protein
MTIRDVLRAIWALCGLAAVVSAGIVLAYWLVSLARALFGSL